MGDPQAEHDRVRNLDPQVFLEWIEREDTWEFLNVLSALLERVLHDAQIHAGTTPAEQVLLSLRGPKTITAQQIEASPALRAAAKDFCFQLSRLQGCTIAEFLREYQLGLLEQ